MNFDNKIPFQQAIDLAKKVAGGELSLQTVKEACWILGCTIESLDGDVPLPPMIKSTQVPTYLSELRNLAEEVTELQQGFGDASAITPAQIALIIQLAMAVIKLFRK
jgi:hypothetical protein